MQAPADPGLLLDREAELEALEAAVGAASAGRGRLVVAEGAAGQGKTALLAVARRRAEQAGVEVLAARGSELESEVPFGVALELFAAQLQAAGPAERAELFRGAAELAAPLFSGTTFDDEDGGGSVDAGGGGRAGPPSSFPVVHGLYWLLANLAERAARLVVVDDAHWADAASLRFMLYLAERLEGLPVSLVVALRPEEVAAGATGLSRLQGAPQARVLHLQPLGKDDTVRLIRRHYFPDADGAFCRAVYDVSDGNPFILREVLAVVDLEGMPPTAASAPAVRRLAPESVVRATRTRLARLRPPAAELAEAVAVLDQDADLTRAAALAGLDRRTAAAAAAELVRAGLLRGDAALEFAQPPLWSAVYTGIPPGRRGALHGRAVGVLADEHHLPPERLAAHLLHSPPAGRAEAVERLQTAARRAVGLGATDVAARYLRRALAEPPPADRHAAVLLQLGRVGAMTGDPEAVDHLRATVDLLPDAVVRAEALAELGRVLADRGRFREATAAFHQALADAGPEPSALRRGLLAAQLQATRLAPGSRDPGLLKAAEEAAEAADSEVPTPGRRPLLGELAFEWLLAGGRFDDVRGAAHRALAGLELPFGDGAGGLAFYNAVAALTWADDLEVAEESLDRAVAESERIGDLTAVATASFRRAVVAYLRGAVPAAVADAQRAVDAAAYGWASYLPAARGILALALTEQGELLRAASTLVAAEEATGPAGLAGAGAAEPSGAAQPGGAAPADGAAGAVPGSPTMAIFLQARATLHLVEGAPGDALADALAAGDFMTAGLGTETAAIVPWRSLAAVAHHRLGDTAAARRLAGEEVVEARRFGAPRALGRALRVAGLVEGGSRGVTLLRESVGELAGSPARLENARALGDLGAALLRAGRDGATDNLRRGLELAEAGGAVVLAERLRGELAGAGVRPPRRGRRRPTDLTPAEERVAQLAAGGLTNKELAQHLFVSVRAVEFHLGNVFTKLGISSRRQLAAALEARPGRGGLPGTG